MKSKHFIRYFCRLLFIGLIATSLFGCKSSKTVVAERSSDLRSEISSSTHRPMGAGKYGKRIVEEALTWLDTPYKYAGAEKGVGTDCSGMVLRVYEDVTGIKIPRNSALQAEFCDSIDAGSIQFGDLAFFATGNDPNRISHVGIMIDNNRFIHSSTSKGVLISDINTPYYQRTFRMFGHVRQLDK